jgi:pimeloyl-ACP methyl ester carboxylesterase
MRALEPDETGFTRGIYWERFGDGESTVLFVPPWAIVHSRIWKMQVPYFARHFRVVVFDPRGNGRSERPADPAAYAETEYADDALAVLDASGTEQAVVVSLSLGAQRALLLADAHPERVLGLAFIAPAVRLVPDHPMRGRYARLFGERLDTDEGWAKFNAHYWRRDYRAFLEFFFSQAFTEPHSTKQTEDAVGWGLESDAATLTATALAEGLDERATREIAVRIHCPVLVIHGADDAIRPVAAGQELAAATGGEFIRMLGVGHCPQARKPVAVNLALREFAEKAARSTLATAAGNQRKEEVHGYS